MPPAQTMTPWFGKITGSPSTSITTESLRISRTFELIITFKRPAAASCATLSLFLGLARVNAAAVGQDLVHAAITGKSTFISASGEVGEATELFEELVLFGEVRFRDAGRTLYTRLGDWLAIVAIAGSLAAVLVPGEGRPERRLAAAQRS